jgi:hypothetical protein
VVRRHWIVSVVVLAVLVTALWPSPEALAQAGKDVGENLGDLLKRYAGQIYGGVIAIVSLIFLLNRRYTGLGAPAPAQADRTAGARSAPQAPRRRR